MYSIFEFYNLPFIALIGFFIYHYRSNCSSAPSNITKNNRVVVITGCDSGIGHTLAKLSLNWGYYVVACCLDLKSEGAITLKSISADVIKVDVCQKDFVSKVTDKLRVLQQEGKVIWSLVNNAGIMTYAKTEWLTWDLIQAQLLVNLSGTIQMTRIAMPFLRQSKGRVINISSPMGLVSSPFTSIYCASKCGVESFSRALRREVSAHNVKVIVLRPCNLPHKTSILKKVNEQLKIMKQEMSEESRKEFAEELKGVEDTFSSAFSDEIKLDDIHDTHLMHYFRCAVECPEPLRSYTAAPLIVRVILNAFTCLPDALMDILISWDIHHTVISWGKAE